MPAPRLPDLPVSEVLPALATALDAAGAAIVVAPPGAGKTTLVAPFLLDAPWLAGRQIHLLLPRRLAARAAAERIATLLGEPVGRQVGYQTRLDSKVGPNCRILCATHGIFANRITADPELPGIGLVLFDEVHERSLESDLALALALDVQGALRPDLRLVAMSATVDGAAYARLMDGAPVIESQGRTHPVTIHHTGRPAVGARLEAAMASTICLAMAAHPGSLLAFLPGVAEIARVAEQLALPPDVALHRLHGNADPADQRAAIAPAPGRKCVLATSIAETSLTVDGVRLVVDSGLARRPRRDPSSGFTRLATTRLSAAAAAQRAGRAGRQAPGIVWRLWDAAETAGLLPQDPPEILEADLAPLLLRLAAFGVTDPASLRWLDPPPASGIAAARAQLQRIGAVGSDGRITQQGRAMQELGLAPPLAAMLLQGARDGAADAAAHMAVLLEEQGLGGRSADLGERMAAFARESGARADAARALAARWARQARGLAPAPPNPEAPSPALLLASAFPDRVARRRRTPGPSDQTVPYLMAGGTGALLDATDLLAQSEWLVVADAGGAGPDARIRLAMPLPADDLAHWADTHADEQSETALDPSSGRVVAQTVRRLGAITLARHRKAPLDPARIARVLLEAVRTGGLATLPWTATDLATRARLAFAHAHGLASTPAMDEASLLARLPEWLEPRLDGVERLADVALDGALLALLDWPTMRALDHFAPARLATPAGTSHAIDYAADAGPTAEIRVQALFGLAAHPMLADGRVPLRLALTSPAGRPIAITTDLPGFWRTGWPEVRRTMKGRYPRHPWPEDPLAAPATVRVKAAART